MSDTDNKQDAGPSEREEEGNLVKHARNELVIAGFFDEDSDYNGALGHAVMELVKVFEKQEHSGMSAKIVNQLFPKVADFKPLTPLKCTKDEWYNSFDEIYQNKRCSSVFKDSEDGMPYYLYGIVFKDEEGTTFTGNAFMTQSGKVISSMKYFRPPFRPKTFFVNVEYDQDQGDYVIKDESQLKEVYDYYVDTDNNRPE